MARGTAPADAIVVAAGGSTRMDGVDKLLVRIGDRPLLAHTIGALAASDAVESIVVVTSRERQNVLTDGDRTPAARVRFVDGGATSRS